MKINIRAVIFSALVITLVSGCAKQADTNKPLEQIKQEVEGMSLNQLENTAQAYAREISVQKKKLGEIQTRLKQLSPADLLGDKAQGIKKDVSAVAARIKALTARYDLYAAKYRTLGGDLGKIKIG